MKVMLDRDLAGLYGVETRTLNQKVKRNQRRFPSDFMFQMTKEDIEEWKSQIVISDFLFFPRLFVPLYPFYNRTKKYLTKTI